MGAHSGGFSDPLPKGLPTKPFMLQDGPLSSDFWSNTLLASLVIFIVLLMAGALLNKNFGYFPHLFGVLAVVSYFKHLHFIFYHMVDPVEKSITKYSGSRDNPKPTQVLLNRDMHSIAIDVSTSGSYGSVSNSRTYFDLVMIDRRGKKHKLYFTSYSKDSEIREKGEFLASVLGIPFADTETSFGFRISHDDNGEICVEPIEIAEIQKKVGAVVFIILILVILMCAFSFYAVSL